MGPTIASPASIARAAAAQLEGRRPGSHQLALEAFTTPGALHEIQREIRARLAAGGTPYAVAVGVQVHMVVRWLEGATSYGPPDRVWVDDAPF